MSTYARTSLRAAIATVALAGAFLAPAAAFAATSAPAAASASSADRYDGEKVLVYKDASHGVLAVLRNGAEGPEAWLRAAGPNWKPGDAWAFRVVGAVTRQEPSVTVTEFVPGLKAQLLKADTATPVLRITAPDGSVKTYALPQGTAAKPSPKPSGKPSAKPKPSEPVDTKGCTVTRRENIGAGMLAVLTMGTKGPSVTFEAGDHAPVTGLGKLDRRRPKLPVSAGIYAEILNPYGSAPQLKAKTQGGDDTYGYAAFPKLPKGCTLDGTSGTPVNAPTQNGGQTTVVPKGAVAAGADIKQGGGDDTALIAGGAGLAVVAAGGYVVLRRRNAARI
ncbi:hypothetical protein ACFXKR_23300 [Streptomyces violascens]|uniref:hypothetical protein n=1 Tax=Streptomyces violascens TaxID=67381 RepID=UPI0036AAFA90